VNNELGFILFYFVFIFIFYFPLFYFLNLDKNVVTALLFLLPPSCMVEPIRNLENITSNILTIYKSTLNMTANDDVDMGVNSFDQLFQGASDNFDKV